MADTATATPPAAGHDAHGHAHPPHLAHHFDTPVQQFESGKLGMWLFLATEVLLFGGLFCAYFIYRSNHMEMFSYAHQYLDKKLGAINTVILLASSFTMAWAVYCAQRGNQLGLKVGLALTFMGGLGFMCIKYVEYSHKIHKGQIWGKHYSYKSGDKHDPAPAGEHGASPAPAAHGAAPATPAGGDHGAAPAAGTDHAAATPAAAPSGPMTADGQKIEQSSIGAAAAPPSGLAQRGASSAGKAHHHGEAPPNVHIYFSIYYSMTGLHGIHVLVGMAIIAWLFVKASKGAFSPEYFTPVDLGGLYWHLVDLIWIYLFPLLYLIE